MWIRTASHIFPNRESCTADVLKWHIPQVFASDNVYKNAGPAIRTLVDNGAAVYLASGFDVFLIETELGFQIIDSVYRINTNFIDEQIFVKWLIQHWELSRGYLMHKLIEAVNSFIHKLNQNFDEACAVSFDGTRLVRADRVLVVYHSFREQSAPYYIEEHDAKIFLRDKLVRPCHQNSVKDAESGGLDKAARSIADGHWDSYYCRKQGADKNLNYYVISAMHVPVDLLAKVTPQI
jgi:hypothetical protein